MRKYIYTIMMIAAVSAALAIPVTAFKSWDDLIENSPEIVIARCTATDDGLMPKPSAVYANIFASDIEVISVLKGTTNTDSSIMASFYRPYRGEQFLMFANDKKDQYNAGYSAVEGYRVVPLNRDYNQYVWDHYLAGKPLKEQIQWILKNRIKDLNGEIAKDNEEKHAIESGLDETNRVIITETNAPPKLPSRAGVF